MRAVLDKLISWTGLLLAVVLLVAGGLLTWANVFIGDQVEQQFASQNITMPEGESLESLPAEDREALEDYAGEPLTTGPQARAYADHYILAHMNASSEGRTYSEVSGEYLGMVSDPKADPAELKALGELRQSMFMGSTLRGLLLYGFAFATVGTIAGYAAVVSFVAAALLLVLVGLGLRHARRTEAAVVDTDRRVTVPAGA